jgi:hypothetical protein
VANESTKSQESSRTDASRFHRHQRTAYPDCTDPGHNYQNVQHTRILNPHASERNAMKPRRIIILGTCVPGERPFEDHIAFWRDKIYAVHIPSAFNIPQVERDNLVWNDHWRGPDVDPPVILFQPPPESQISFETFLRSLREHRNEPINYLGSASHGTQHAKYWCSVRNRSMDRRFTGDSSARRKPSSLVLIAHPGLHKGSNTNPTRSTAVSCETSSTLHDTNYRLLPT